jgi:hypothetical protein
VSTRTDNPVTLSHADALQVRLLLHDYARAQHAHANRSRSAAVRESCNETAKCADILCERITKAMWSWNAERGAK